MKIMEVLNLIEIIGKLEDGDPVCFPELLENLGAPEGFYVRRDEDTYIAWISQSMDMRDRLDDSFFMCAYNRRSPEELGVWEPYKDVREQIREIEKVMARRRIYNNTINDSVKQDENRLMLFR